MQNKAACLELDFYQAINFFCKINIKNEIEQETTAAQNTDVHNIKMNKWIEYNKKVFNYHCFSAQLIYLYCKLVRSFFYSHYFITFQSPGFCLRVQPYLPTDQTGSFFFQKRIRPLLSNYFLYYSIVIKHFTDFSYLLLTQGASLAKPILFQIGLDLLVRDFWIITLISLVFLGSSHSQTQEGDRITGILQCTNANSGVASLVRIIIQFQSVQRPATRKWSEFLGLKQKGYYFDFHQQYPSMMTTHLFSIIFINVRFPLNYQILPLMIILKLVFWPHLMNVNSLSLLFAGTSFVQVPYCRDESAPSSLRASFIFQSNDLFQRRACYYFYDAAYSFDFRMTGMQVVGHTLNEVV